MGNPAYEIRNRRDEPAIDPGRRDEPAIDPGRAAIA
jgi:hypothetical protein